MATLPTNFKDDILDTSVNTRRRYRMYENTDGTVEFEDVTEYQQVGDNYGSGQINATNAEVNTKFDKNMIVRDIDTIGAITKEGYVPDALALKEVNDSLETSLQNIELPYISNDYVLHHTITTSGATISTYTVDKDCIIVGQLTQPNGTTSAYVKLNDMQIAYTFTSGQTSSIGVSPILVKTGDVIGVRGGVIRFYAK